MVIELLSGLIKLLNETKHLTKTFLILVRQKREVTVCEDDEIVADSNCECAQGSSVGQTGSCVVDACKFYRFFISKLLNVTLKIK